MKPFLQGNLDGLCGVYSAVNCAKLINGGMSQNIREDLFVTILQVLSEKKDIIEFLTCGLTTMDLSNILRVICSDCSIVRSKPFHKKADAALSTFWGSLQEFLNVDEQRAVIIGIDTKDDGHWTVVKSISEKRMNLFDSGYRKHLNRKMCSTTEISVATPVMISPLASTYFLQRDK